MASLRLIKEVGMKSWRVTKTPFVVVSRRTEHYRTLAGGILRRKTFWRALESQRCCHPGPRGFAVQDLCSWPGAITGVGDCIDPERRKNRVVQDDRAWDVRESGDYLSAGTSPTPTIFDLVRNFL